MSRLQDILYAIQNLESRISKIENMLEQKSTIPLVSADESVSNHPIFTLGRKISLSSMPFHKARNIYLNMGGSKENCILNHMVKHIFSYPEKLSRLDFYTIIFNFNLDDHFAYFIGVSTGGATLEEHRDFFNYCFCL